MNLNTFHRAIFAANMITARTTHGSGGHSSMGSTIAASPEPLPNIFVAVIFAAPSMTMSPSRVVCGIMRWHIRGKLISVIGDGGTGLTN
jgi:hypothetical protein